MSKYVFDLDLSTNTSTGAIINQINPESTVLEFGCAAGRMTKYMKEQLGCKVYIVEICKEDYDVAIEYAENGFCGDIMGFAWCDTFSSIKFDYILFADVLEHLSNPELVLKKVAGLLKDDGKIICSIPNNGHADVLLNLYENKFNYKDLGLLDNTHIHLFAYHNIGEMAENAGYSVVYEGATYAKPLNTEQSQSLNNNESDFYQQLLTNHTFSDVYQFIIAMQKKEFVEQNTVVKQSDLNFYPEFSNCHLILNNDFSNPLVLTPESRTGYRYTYKTKFQPCNEFVVSPIVNTSSVILDFNVNADENAEITYLNACEIENVFFVKDNIPQIRIKFKQNIESLTFELTVFPIYDDIQNILFNKSIENFRKTEETINAKETYINELQQELECEKNHNAEISQHYLTALNFYEQISNSFFWRITAPVRKVSQALKDFLSKHRMFLMAAIYLKGFLRGGFKGGKSRIDSYLAQTDKRKCNPTVISKKLRRVQTRYRFSKNIKFSVLVPLYNTPKNFLLEMIQSVQAQTYSNWELCLADGSTEDFSYVEQVCKNLAKKDKRIIYKKLEKNLGISENTNACIAMATGDYIALFDHDDVLHPSALFECMKQICDKDADYIYTDEATFLGDDITNIITYHYKPDFSQYNLLANNYICHFSVFATELLEKAGNFRNEYDGSQDHDIILRLTDAAKNVVHISKLLYFWRSHANSVAMDINSKTYAIKAGQNAVHDFLLSKGIESKVTSSPAFPTIYRVEYEIKGEPLVSIIIPNKNHYEDLLRCISSIKTKTTYKNYEILVVDNGSTDDDVKQYYEELKSDNRIKILSYDFPFNYSAINNYAVSKCSGEYLLLLNNDTEVITSRWIEELLMYAQKEDIGAVGAKLFYGDNTVQHGGIILKLGKDRVAGHSHHKADAANVGYMGKMFYAQNISAVTAACLMVKKSKYMAVEGFDEQQAVAYNDVDFCLKLDEVGLKNIFNPFCELYHYESLSRGLDTAAENRNRFLTETNRFKEKWKEKLKVGDPYYNSNFSLDESYAIK